MKKIEIDHRVGKKSKAHYSAATVHGDIVHVSGQLPIDPDSGLMPEGNIEAQTRLALQNLARVLEAAGSSMDKVLRTTAYVADITLWNRVNAMYAEVFGDHKPARTIVATAPLHYGALIEIDAVAFIE